MSRRFFLPVLMTLVTAAPALAIDVTGSSSPALPITVGAPVSDVITLVDSLVIADAQADIDITHTWRGDVTLVLESTAGATSVTLTNGAGGSADNINITFASVGIPFSGAQLADGIGVLMEASGPGTMADFHGADSADDWTITATDCCGGDDGTLNFWALTFSDIPMGPLPPVNDDCTGAITLSDGSLEAFDNSAATDSGIISTCTSSGADIWYVFSTACDADVTIDLSTSLFDTTLQVHDTLGAGCPVGSSTVIACNDDGGPGTTSLLTFPATAGSTYHIQVGGFSGDTGTGEIGLTAVNVIPANDLCSGAEVIGDGLGFPWSNVCATQSGDNPGCASTTNPYDLWYEYTASCDGQLTIDTNGSTFDTRLALWDACGGTVIECDDDDGVGTQSLITLTGVVTGQVFLIQVGGFSSAQGNGILNIECGLPDVIPVGGLTCEASAGSVDVSWTNGDLYDSIEIYVDSVLTETLLGDATATTLSATEFTTVEVCVRPILAGTTPIDSCCTVDIPGDATGLVVIVDGDTGGDLDNAAAVSAALTALAVDHIIVGSTLSYTGIPAELYVLLGTFPANTALSDDEGQAIFDAQAAGTPIYVSGGDTWGFDAATAMNMGDGIDNETALDGNDSFVDGTGAGTFAGFDFAYTQDQIGNDYTDQIDPITDLSATADAYGTNASVAWSDTDDLYNVGVLYDTGAGIGNALCTSWELAGYGGDQVALMDAIRMALAGGPPPGPEFVRGDTNADGMFNIADMINLLGVLFPSGSPTNFPCEDAGDTNDDGMLNIADAINGLGVLFPSGSPAIIPAPFGACGQDPTDGDALGCDSFPACP